MRSLGRERDRLEIIERVRRLRPGLARRWGRMSAHQMVCHVADAYRMASGEKPVRPVTGPFPRSILKWGVLYLPIPWPHGISTCRELDQELGGTRPVGFSTDLATLVALVERASRPPLPLDPPPHPIFGRMSAADWQRWGYLHADHHLRQFGM